MNLVQLAPIQNVAQDSPIQRIQGDFTGEWQPDLEPLKIINGNFSDVQNIRYLRNKTGIVVVNGYTKVNVTTALSAYPKGRSGFQLRSPHTQKSYIFTQQYNTGLTSSVIYLHKGVPPATGDFETTTIHSDASGALNGSFVEAPDNNIVYSNGVETLIYGGEESHISAFLLTSGYSGITPTNPIEYTDQMRNTLTTSSEIVSVPDGTYSYWIASTRPLSMFKPYIVHGFGNIINATITVNYWSGTAWTPCTSVIDGTKIGSKTHAQTGVVSFDSTVATAKPILVNDTLFYWYIVQFTGAGPFKLYHVTVSSPIQPLVNLWDGVNHTCIQCQISRSSVYEDYTPEVAETSTVQYPIAAKFAGILSTDHAILMFSDRMTAFKFTFIAALVNATAASVTIQYWTGSAWTSVGTVYDGTMDTGGTKSMAQNGTMFWNALPKSGEHAQTLFGIHGYAYKLSWSATLTADTGTMVSGCYVDTIYGIPASDVMGAYKFAFNYKNRLFLAGDVAGKEGHGIDYSVKDTVDCFNGADSSANGKRLYIGDNSSDVVAAVNIFNRFGANIYNSELLLKSTQVFLLDGEGPESYRVSQISDNLGTQAPRTVCTAEVAFEVTKDAIRNIAMWVSNSGPVIFDAAVLVPVRGVNLYFDRTKTTCVNFDAMDKAHAWFDPNYFEWNVCLPVGVGQTTCNVWLTYDLVEKRWSKRDVGLQYIPQATAKVVDDYGNIYFYGFIDDGHMVRLENGMLWNDTEQVQAYVTTNAMVPSGSLYDIATVRNLKLVTEGDGTYDIIYTRSDIEIKGSGIESGDLRVYGELTEDGVTLGSYWDGEDFVCQELNEYQTVIGASWEDDLGIVNITGDLHEGWDMEITTVAGDFVAAGFLPGLVVMTSDPNNPGPFLCTTVTVNKMTFTSGKAVDFQSGASITLYALFVQVYSYLNGDTVPTIVPFNKVELGDEFVKLTASCGYTGLSHMYKFVFYSTALKDNIKPLAWGIQYIIERDDN